MSILVLHEYVLIICVHCKVHPWLSLQFCSMDMHKHYIFCKELAPQAHGTRNVGLHWLWNTFNLFVRVVPFFAQTHTHGISWPYPQWASTAITCYRRSHAYCLQGMVWRAQPGRLHLAVLRFPSAQVNANHLQALSLYAYPFLSYLSFSLSAFLTVNFSLYNLSSLSNGSIFMFCSFIHVCDPSSTYLPMYFDLSTPLPLESFQPCSHSNFCDLSNLSTSLCLCLCTSFILFYCLYWPASRIMSQKLMWARWNCSYYCRIALFQCISSLHDPLNPLPYCSCFFFLTLFF